MEHIQMSGSELAERVQANRAQVLSNLRRVTPSMVLRREILAELADTKRYLRYNSKAAEGGELFVKLVIVVVYEALGLPDNAIHEINKLMYS